ncbi:MAG TPA: hypothetical protein VER08_02895 [Pyrinomonadaceae bacterium]|nr:hypothetical protein [Pyrinomonadaceae bacterium]
MKNQNARTLKLTALWLVGLHFLFVALHSAAHEVLKVKATPAQLAFILPVIIVAPVVAAFLLPKFGRAGTALLLVSMLGSFVFGLYYHFVADTIDHVAHVAHMRPASWSAVFRVTAYLLAVSEVAGAAVAGLLAVSRPQPFKAYATRTGF